MDFEKTIQERVDALVRVAELHSEQIGQLDSAIKTVADAMAEEHKRTQEHARGVDERIDKLVIAIGEFDPPHGQR